MSFTFTVNQRINTLIKFLRCDKILKDIITKVWQKWDIRYSKTGHSKIY